VWLIYILVIWWTALPATFAAATLFIPLALALAWIVLGGQLRVPQVLGHRVAARSGRGAAFRQDDCSERTR
jgi:hypothetical protein